VYKKKVLAGNQSGTSISRLAGTRRISAECNTERRDNASVLQAIYDEHMRRVGETVLNQWVATVIADAIVCNSRQRQRCLKRRHGEARRQRFRDVFTGKDVTKGTIAAITSALLAKDAVDGGKIGIDDRTIRLSDKFYLPPVVFDQLKDTLAFTTRICGDAR